MRTRASLLQQVKDLSNEIKWQEFYELYSDLIFYGACRAGLSPDEAEDLVQVVFIELMSRMADFKYDPEVGSFRGWLLQRVKWRARDVLRQRHTAPGRTETLSDPTGRGEVPISLEIPDETWNAQMEEFWEKEWRKTMVSRALQQLQESGQISSKHFQILELLFARGLPPADVAQRLGIRRGVVDNTHFRCKDLLRQALKRLGESQP